MQETTATPPQQASPWILNPASDLGLFIATPLLILPLTLALLEGLESTEIQYLILAFGAMGHNLPGMLRAYGDRELFRRFRMRFILAPIVLGGLVLAFAWQQFSGVQANGIVVIALLWSIWHALMQVYGFSRIYDAKVGAVQRLHARMDFAMCLGWFAGALVFSDSRLHYIQSLFSGYGVPPMEATSIETLRVAVITGLIALTAAFAWIQVRDARASKRPASRKNLLLVSAISFWWYANVAIDDVLLGLVMFELFHDVQYLAIVWIFNRRRAETNEGAGSFTRFVFRRSWAMMGLYLGMVLAYGGFLPATRSVESPVSAGMVATFVTTSALLHYYFDGFIWKIREGSVRGGLGLAGGKMDSLVSWHGAKWLFLLVPAGLMLSLDTAGPMSVERAQALVKSTPNVDRGHLDLGAALEAEKRFAEAVDQLERSVALDPKQEHREYIDSYLPRARVLAAKEELRNSNTRRAEQLLKMAAEKIPDLASACNNDGIALRAKGQLVLAVVSFRCALLLNPEMAQAHLNLGLTYRSLGQVELALRHARRGAELLPADQRAKALAAELEQALKKNF
ncbi:MAG: tetratricopeptide repeat protein [Planctomycetota bacterium]|nr:tetratricopeptide repeat protein [Planctomycetota bacterium]